MVKIVSVPNKCLNCINNRTRKKVISCHKSFIFLGVGICQSTTTTSSSFYVFFFSVLVASFNFQPLKLMDESTTCPIKTEGNPYVSLAAIFHCSMPVPHKLQRPSYRENTEDNSRQSLVRQSQRNTLDRRGRLTTLSQRVIIEMMWGFLFCFLDWHLDLRQPTN